MGAYQQDRIGFTNRSAIRRLGLVALLGALPLGAPAQEAALDYRSLHKNILGVYTSGPVGAYTYAAEQYLTLLRAIPEAADTEAWPLARQHLLFMDMVMEEADPARAELAHLLTGGGGDIETLISWWHRQDPLPHSSGNERLQEHLARIAYALEHFARDDDERGFDDRGEIYVRLGPPARSKVIKILSAGVWLNPYSARLPDNDFWVYRQVDKEAHYLFVRASRRRPYRIATAEDLIPRELVGSRRRVALLLPILDEIFAQLALAHPYYGTTYDAINSYLNVPGYTSANAYQFVRRLITKMRLDEDFYDRNRKHIIPAAFSNTLGGAAPLVPALRWARFLEPDGRTRIELYWSLSSDALAPSRRLVRRLERDGHAPTAQYLISFSVARRDSAFRADSIDTRHFMVPTSLHRRLHAQSWAAVTSRPLTHLALQWEQRWAHVQEGAPLTAGATLKIGTRTLDSLRALSADPARLGMSDIKPMMVPAGAALHEATLYPGTALQRQDPIALYFEVYHLMYGADDRTHFAVEYQVESAAQPGRNPLSVRSSYNADSRTARETIRLDLSTWDISGPVDITVRVTDEVSGQSAARSLQFDFEAES